MTNRSIANANAIAVRYDGFAWSFSIVATLELGPKTRIIVMCLAALYRRSGTQGLMTVRTLSDTELDELVAERDHSGGGSGSF